MLLFSSSNWYQQTSDKNDNIMEHPAHVSSPVEVASSPPQGVALQPRKNHLRGRRVISAVSPLAVVVACSVLLFAVSSCAIRLASVGAHRSRSLAGLTGSGHGSPVDSCTSSDDEELDGAHHHWAPGASAPALNLPSHGTHDEHRQTVKGHHYPFSAIPGETNQHILQQFMRKIRKWKHAHLGRNQRSCSIRLGNVKVSVHAAEVAVRSASESLEALILRSEAELRAAGPSSEGVFNGFMINEHGPIKGKIHFFVDAVWDDSTGDAPADDRDGSGDDGDEGAAGGEGSTSFSASQQQLGVISEEEEQEGAPSRVIISPGSGAVAYRFLRFPGEENQRRLMALVEAFSETSIPHQGNKKKMCSVSLGPVRFRVQMTELRSQPGWPTPKAAYLAAVQLEDALLRATQKVHDSAEGTPSCTESFTFEGNTEFVVKAFRRAALSALTEEGTSEDLDPVARRRTSSNSWR